MKVILKNSTIDFAIKTGWGNTKLPRLHEYGNYYYSGGNALNSFGGPSVCIYKLNPLATKVKMTLYATSYDAAKDYFLSDDVTSAEQTGISSLIVPMSDSQSYIRVGTESMNEQVIDIPQGAKYILINCIYQRTAEYPVIYEYIEPIE